MNTDKLVRGLQSRTAKRGVYLAWLETRRQDYRSAIGMMKQSGYPFEILKEIREESNGIRQEIRSQAADQKLDRLLLRNIHQNTRRLRVIDVVANEIKLWAEC